jgi:hypothetical protein
MVALNQNVYAAEPSATGTCFVAPMGSTPPTKALFDAGTYTLAPAFIDLGHIGEDGYTETKDIKTEDKRNFGGKVVKVLQTEVTYTYKFVFLESLSANVLKAVYGAANVTVTPATSTIGTLVEIKKNTRKLPHQMWVLDTIDSELDAHYRSYIPDGQIITLGDVKIVHSDVIMYEVEVRAFEDPTGVSIYTWTNDGRVSTGS